jgi:VanZ family protein
MLVVDLSFNRRVWGIAAITPVLLFFVYILVRASQDTQWGGGTWETWLTARFGWDQALAHTVVFWLRKTIHFTGYGTISLLFWLYYYLWKFPKPGFLGVFSCVVIAAFDEYNQSLTSFRSGKPADVLLDICGAVVFYLGACWWLKRNETLRSKHDRRN